MIERIPFVEVSIGQIFSLIRYADAAQLHDSRWNWEKTANGRARLYKQVMLDDPFDDAMMVWVDTSEMGEVIP